MVLRAVTPDQAQDIIAELRRIASILEIDPSDLLLMSYPNGGGLRAIPAGVTTLDLRKGMVRRPDGSAALSDSLDSHGHQFAKAVNLFADADVDIELLSRGKSSGKFQLHQCNYRSISSVAIDLVRLTATYPFNFQFLSNTIPGAISDYTPATAFQERFGSIAATLASFTALPFGPTGGGALAAADLNDVIPVSYMGDKLFVVTNTGANGLDMNVQVLLVGGRTWVNDPVTGASTPLSSGSSALIETGLPCQFIRLRLRSTTAGSPTSADVQYLGTTVIR